MAASLYFNIKSKNPQDDYKLFHEIGHGAYGAVFKARRTKDGLFSAVKIVEFEPGDEFSKIQQEILMMKSCCHPNIVAYFDSYLLNFERYFKLWICMEYCGGGSLRDIYCITGPLSELQIAYTCRETLKGLEYLHSLGILHRDIKGANILLTDDGDVKLADFGVSAKITATISKRNSVIGTTYWMAPEITSDEYRGYNQKCDIWSVGITSIELAELKPPMVDPDPWRALILMSKPGFKPPSLSDKMTWSQHFHDFVKKSLTINPKERPTAQKLLQDPFVKGNLTKQLTKELLDIVKKHHKSVVEDAEDDGESANNDFYDSSNEWKENLKEVRCPPLPENPVLQSSFPMPVNATTAFSPLSPPFSSSLSPMVPPVNNVFQPVNIAPVDRMQGSVVFLAPQMSQPVALQSQMSQTNVDYSLNTMGNAVFSQNLCSTLQPGPSVNQLAGVNTNAMPMNNLALGMQTMSSNQPIIGVNTNAMPMNNLALGMQTMPSNQPIIGVNTNAMPMNNLALGMQTMSLNQPIIGPGAMNMTSNVGGQNMF